MELLLGNESLRVAISTLGGELQSIRAADGTEYLWQGDPAYWSDRAINLFPYVGRLTGGRYRYKGREYEMGIHGFWRRLDMAVEAQSSRSCALLLRDSAETLAQYPFPFALRLRYRLEEQTLCIIFEVQNTGKETMYFGIGGHPGFHVPLEKNLSFEDYSLVFEQAGTPERVGFTEACFLSGQDAPFPLEEGRRLRLHHSLFDDDAIVLKGMDTAVCLQSEKGAKSVRVSYPGMPYLGLWHKPKSDAPYVCIEPWSSLPARQDVVEEITEQAGLIALPAEKLYQSKWSIECR